MIDLEAAIAFVRRRRDPLLALGLLTSTGLVLGTLLPVVSPFLVALVIAYVLAPLIDGMRRVGVGGWRPTRMSCVLSVFIVLFGGVLVFGLPLVVNVASGLIHIAHGLEDADLQRQALETIGRYRTLVTTLPLPAEVLQRADEFFHDPEELSKVLVLGAEKGRVVLAAVLRGGARFLTTFLSAGVQIFLVPVLLFYFLLEYDQLYPGMMAWVPLPYRGWFERFLVKVDRRLGGFVRGQLLIAFLFGLIMTGGLWAIGIRYAIVLGPLSGIANLVPYLGVVVGLVPAFFLALWQGGFSVQALWMCGAILALFVFLQLLDGYVFQPRILGPSVDLHPLTIIFALALGEYWMGLAGMMLAVPVAAVLRVILEEIHPRLYPPDEADGPGDRSAPDPGGAAGDPGGAADARSENSDGEGKQAEE